MKETGAIILLVLGFGGAASAKEQQATLPERILQAKTLFVDNQSKYADVADHFYDEMGKWKRFRLVSKRERDAA